MSVKHLLLSVVAASVLAGSAFADGGPPPPPPPPPPPEENGGPPPPPPPPAYAPSFYVEAEGGVTFVDDLEVNGFPNDMDTGFNFGGALGMHVSPSFDVELDVFYTEMGFVCCDADISGLSTMLDVIYNFNAGGGFNPYIGAGLGAVRVHVDTPGPSDSEWKFGYQAMAGIMMNISQSLGLFVEYRFHDAVGEAALFGNDFEYHSHNVSGGIQISF